MHGFLLTEVLRSECSPTICFETRLSQRPDPDVATLRRAERFLLSPGRLNEIIYRSRVTGNPDITKNPSQSSPQREPPVSLLCTRTTTDSGIRIVQ